MHRLQLIPFAYSIATALDIVSRMLLGMETLGQDKFDDEDFVMLRGVYYQVGGGPTGTEIAAEINDLVSMSFYNQHTLGATLLAHLLFLLTFGRGCFLHSLLNMSMRR